MFRAEPPWLGIEESRSADRQTYMLPKQLQRIIDVLLTVSEIAAKREICNGSPIFYRVGCMQCVLQTVCGGLGYYIEQMIGCVHKRTIEDGGLYDFRLAETAELAVKPVGKEYY